MRSRASWRASSSRADVPMHADQHLLGDQQAIAQDLPLGEVERRLQHGGERLREVLVLAGDALEPLHLGLERLGHDLVEAVELGLEVVIQRGRADTEGCGDVRPLAVLVALAAEQLGRGLEDRRSLAAGRRGTAIVGASVAWLAWLRHGFLGGSEVGWTIPAVAAGPGNRGCILTLEVVELN